jgi:hypothetical protein
VSVVSIEQFRACTCCGARLKAASIPTAVAANSILLIAHSYRQVATWFPTTLRAMQFYQTIVQSSLCPVVMVICSRGNEARLRDRAKVLTMDEARRLAANIAKLPQYQPANPSSD